MFRLFAIKVEVGAISRLRKFVRKFSSLDFFLNILPLKDDELVKPETEKTWGGGGVTIFVLEKTYPEEHLNLVSKSSKSGFISEEGHSGCN